MKTPTFCAIVTQGCFGAVPGNAMSYQTLFFQVGGIRSGQAAALQACQMGVSAIGRLLGGRVGDALARRWPKHGRPLTAQISVACGVPLAACIFLRSPPAFGAFPYYLLLVILMGLSTTWCSAGVNRPILSEIVGADRRSSIMAWQSALEGTFSAIFGNVAVGILAEDVFGYNLQSARSKLGSMADEGNRHALGTALLLTTSIPWMVCFIFYSLLHWSYSRDLRRLQEGGAKQNPTKSHQSKSDVEKPHLELKALALQRGQSANWEDCGNGSKESGEEAGLLQVVASPVKKAAPS